MDTIDNILFQLNPLPTWVYDSENFRMLDVNAAAIAMFGTPKEAVLLLLVSEWQPTANWSHDRHEQTISRETCQNSQGELFSMEIRRHPIFFEGRSACLVVGQVLTTATPHKEEYQRLKLFEQIVTHTNDAVLVTEAEPVDLPGPRIVYVNEAFCKMTGYEAHEVIGKTPRILQGPLSDFSELKAMGQSLRQWRPHEITTINYKKNGEPFWVNFTVTPIADSQGWFTHWIAIERDVTKSIELAESLSKAKETAEDNERKMKEAQRLARLGSRYYDFTNQVSQWSEETYKIWGLDPTVEVVNLADHEHLVHPKDWQRFNEVINHAIAHAIPYKMELDLVKADGTYKTVNTIGSPIFNENGELIAYEGTTQDISDRVAIENELRAAKEKAERMQHIVSEASRLAKIGYLDHDFTTDTITWSDYMYQLFGLQPGVAIPRDQERLIFYDKISREKLSLANKLLVEEGLPYDVELRLLNPQGEEVFIRKVVQPVWNDRHEVIGKRGLVQNITDDIYLQELNRDVARMVKMGSWRVDLEEATVYWSDQVHHIHETNPKTYVPTLEDGINFYRADFHALVTSAVENAIETGQGWDFEAVIVTAKNNEVWIRSVGSAELIGDKVVRLFGGLQVIHDKKMAQLQLESSLRELQDYKFSLDQSAIIAFTDATGKITDVNENFCRISGYTKAELIGNTHRIIGSQYHPRDFFVKMWQTISAGKVWRGEIKNKAKDGSYYWVDTTIVPFLDHHQKPKQYLAIRFDITDRKKAEEDKQRFYLTLENSLNEIYMFDAETLEFSYVNHGACENLGYSMEEILQLSPLDLKPDFNSKSFRDLLRPLTDGSSDKIVFFTNHRRKDSSLYPVEVHLNRVEAQGMVSYMAIILDITERKKAEAELLATAERLRLATTSAKMGIWDWDVTNNLLSWDDQMYALYDIRPGNFRGSFEHWSQTVHPEDLEKVMTELQNAVAGNRDFNTVFRVIWSDQSIHHIRSYAIVKRNDKGEAVRVIGGNIDVTEHVVRENLLQAHAHDLELYIDRLRSIAWTQSHVVRAPLSRILGIIDLIELEKGSLESVVPLLKCMKTATEEMDEIVKKITRDANEVTNSVDRLG